MWITMGVSMIPLLTGLFLTAFLVSEGPWQLVTILILCVVFFALCFHALKLDVSIGAYKCKNCGMK